MIARDIQREVEKAPARQAAVALIGPRQVGKTTLAHMVAAGFGEFQRPRQAGGGGAVSGAA